MESTKLLTASLLTAGLMVVGTSASAALTDNLVGYYEYDSDFTTSAGTVDGVANGGATAGVAGGIVGNAMSVTPTGGGAGSQFMSTALGYGGAAPLGDNFSVSAWYNLQNPGSSQSARHFVFEGADSFDVSYGIRELDADGIDDGQVFTQNGATGGLGAPNRVDVIDAGTPGWHHVLQTYSSDGTNTTITTYVDGVELANALTLTTTEIVDTGLHFGAARSSAANRGFDGLIDEVALWDRALTDQEAANVYATGLAGNDLRNEVPEPGSLALLGLGGLLIARRRRA
ncbi:LamG domain-containing protein [Phycisphaeraceae bacterium D3-23]